MNTKMLTFVLGFVVVAMVQHGSAYHNCDDIQDNELADLDEDWYLKQVEKGFNVIEQGNFNHIKDNKKWKWGKKFGKGRATGSLQSICYNLDPTWRQETLMCPSPVTTPTSTIRNVRPTSRAQIKLGKRSVSAINKLNLTRDDETGLDSFFSVGGQIKFLKTDNKSYLAGSFCLFSKVATYFILTTSEKILDPKIIASLGKHFKSIGFKRGQNSAKKGITAMFVNKYQSTPCP